MGYSLRFKDGSLENYANCVLTVIIIMCSPWTEWLRVNLWAQAKFVSIISVMSAECPPSASPFTSRLVTQLIDVVWISFYKQMYFGIWVLFGRRWPSVFGLLFNLGYFKNLCRSSLVYRWNVGLVYWSWIKGDHVLSSHLQVLH